MSIHSKCKPWEVLHACRHCKTLKVASKVHFSEKQYKSWKSHDQQMLCRQCAMNSKKKFNKETNGIRVDKRFGKVNKREKKNKRFNMKIIDFHFRMKVNMNGK